MAAAQITAVAGIQSLAWELSYAMSATLKKEKKTKQNKDPPLSVFFAGLYYSFFFFFWSFLRPHLRHMEIPRLGA